MSDEKEFPYWMDGLSRQEAKELLAAQGSFLEFMPQFQDDRELCEIAVQSQGNAYRYVAQDLKGDVQLAALAAKSNHTVINDTPTQVLQEKEYWETALAGDYRLACRLPDKFKEDKELFVIAAEQFKADARSNPKGSWYIPYDVKLSEQFGPGVQAIVKDKTLTQAIEACQDYVQAEREKEALLDQVPQVPRQPTRRMKI